MNYIRVLFLLFIVVICIAYFTTVEYKIETFNEMLANSRISFDSLFTTTTATVTATATAKHFSNDRKNTVEPSRDFKYVTVTCNNGRLGNQIWPIVSGWGIAKRLNRRLYINCEENPKIELIKKVFPKLGGAFEQFKPAKEVSLPLTGNCCEYKDPIKFANRTEKYIRVEITYGQNVRYFYNYRDELDKLLEFGAEVTDKGEMIIQERGLSNASSLICAHIRQTDFQQIKWNRPFEECLEVIQHIAKMKEIRTFLVFGDDKNFMANLTSRLIIAGAVLPNSFYSNYTESEDLYLSKRLCTTFVATSATSSFGFWLSYLSSYPDNVYYIKEDRGEGRPQFDEQFPLPWHPVSVVNGSVIIS